VARPPLHCCLVGRRERLPRDEASPRERGRLRARGTLARGTLARGALGALLLTALASTGLGACGEVRADAVVLAPEPTTPAGGEPQRPDGNASTAGGGQGGSTPPSQPPAPEPDPDPDPDDPAIAGELCSPCTRSSQCGGANDYCLSLRNADRYYCGRDCAWDGDCPAGYECVPLRNAPEIEQCVPLRRDCPP
jgi:hypothetical protein